MPGSLPGELLLAGELQKDQLVEAFATIGGWSPAKVLSVVGEGADASATLKFIGYGPRWNQTFEDSQKSIRVRVSKAQRDLDNMPAVEAACANDMGVFIISPTVSLALDPERSSVVCAARDLISALGSRTWPRCGLNPGVCGAGQGREAAGADPETCPPGLCVLCPPG